MEFAMIVLGPDGRQAIETDVDDLTWTFRSGMLQSCESLEPQSVDRIALHELAVGKVRIRATDDERAIESIRVTVPPPVAAQACLTYDAGLRAQEFGEEAEALETWRPLAESGYPPAQHAVAELLRRGETIEHRPQEAREW